MRRSYRSTMVSCFIGSIVQAITSNYVPLLFVTFQNTWGIPLGQITLLITVNFGVQLLVDLLSSLTIDRIGYRRAIVAAQWLSALGLLLLTILPELMDPFAGLLIAVIVYAVGGGIVEVLISPIMEGCPTKNKEQAMSLLHSFYCWGTVVIILLTTVFFRLAGIDNWRILTVLWAVIPTVNGFNFLRAPIPSLIAPGESGMTIWDLLKSKVFWLLMVIMLCGGAAELAVGQWASAFAEKGLGISKAAGDLAGPMLFAALMGCARMFHGTFGGRINLDRFMLLSSGLCVALYLLISLSPWPVVSLIGCGLCGFSVGILWPGALSRAAGTLRTGGTAMFAILALAGDMGCSAGPALVGAISSLAGGNLKVGILAATLFPALLIVCLLALRRSRPNP